jgi:hypothetical protein
MSLRAIIMPTHIKNEKYIDHCVRAINVFWPVHPAVWVLSDRGRYEHKNSIIINSPHWVEVLKKGIDELLRRNILKNDDYVLLIHEDHIPISDVPEKIITSVVDYAAKKGLKFISFTGHGGDLKVGEIAGLGLFSMRDDFPYYSEHHPAIWHVGHLLDTLNEAMRLNYLDPWKSEKIKIAGVTHYTLGEYHADDYTWPSPFSGFLIFGHVNMKAVRRMESPNLKVLKRMLIIDWICQFPRRIVNRSSIELEHFLARCCPGKSR